MKRFILLTFFCGFLSAPLFAQDNNESSVAEQEEKIKRLSSDVETLLAANADLQKKISALSDELGRIHDSQSKAPNDSGLDSIRDDLRKLAEKIQEVDRKRIADKEVVVDKLEEIERIIKKGISSSSPKSGTRVKETTAPATSEKPTNVAEYEIREGDVLSKILSQVNAQFKSEGKKTITQKQLLDANPGLNPDKLRVGQKILIPLPEK